MKKRTFMTLTVLAVIMVGSCISGNSQGKYFEVVTAAYNSHWGNDKFYGVIVPADKRDNSNAVLNFGGKTKKQLYEAIMQYVKARPTLVLKPKATNEHLITYRDFVTVGSIDSCFADLVALTYVYAIPEDGLVKVSFGINSTIFATIFKAKLQITPDDDVASIGDAPFNEYKYVQPADDGVLQNRSAARTMLLGSGVKRVKRSLKEAYPDSIFDPEGKIVNPFNKRIIENYYDWYAADLNYFIQDYFKK